MEISAYMLKKIKAEDDERTIMINLYKEVQLGNKSAKKIYKRLMKIRISLDNIELPKQKNYSKRQIITNSRKEISDYIDKEYIRALKFEEKNLILLANRQGRPMAYLRSIKPRS